MSETDINKMVPHSYCDPNTHPANPVERRKFLQQSSESTSHRPRTAQRSSDEGQGKENETADRSVHYGPPIRTNLTHHRPGCPWQNLGFCPICEEEV